MTGRSVVSVALSALALAIVGAIVAAALALSALALAAAPAGATGHGPDSWPGHVVDGPDVAAWALADLGSIAPDLPVVITWPEVGRPGAVDRGPLVIGPPPVPAAPCHEDQPCWDWRTMGNGCRGIRSEHGALVMLECWDAETGRSYGRGY